MPHSGGGGSHSGGGGGGHSGGGGGSSVRVSSQPFSGSHTYVVYDKSGSSRLVYTNTRNYHAEVTKGSCISSVILFALFFALPGVIALIIGLVSAISSFHIGLSKTKYPSTLDDTVYIFDNFDYISDSEEQALIDSLTEFRDNTGVIPAVEFTNDSYWQSNYTDMENFAYNEYVNAFADEYHLLIVYSYGYEDSNTGFNEFHWHTMWGDDLGKTIRTKDENFLANELQKEFSIANGKDVPQAVINSMDSLYTHLTGTLIHFDEKLATGLSTSFWGLIFGGAGILTIFSGISNYKKSKMKGEITYKIHGEPEIKTCKYCSCTYYAGTVGTCIHCGAPLEM